MYGMRGYGYGAEIIEEDIFDEFYDYGDYDDGDYDDDDWPFL